MMNAPRILTVTNRYELMKRPSGILGEQGVDERGKSLAKIEFVLKRDDSHDPRDMCDLTRAPLTCGII